MTALVGILNLTPDSFSDGAAYADRGQLLAAAERMIEAGAAVLDVGAESTRPGAAPVTPEKECARLEPFFREAWPKLAGRITLSIDTRHAQTAEYALSRGAQWINDVSGFSDPDMIHAVKNADAKLVFMHSLTVPADPAVTLPVDVDIIAVLRAFARERAGALMAQGIARERLIFDPGLGFGKTAEQSLTIVRRVSEMRAPGFPLLIGHSRKSFLKLLPGTRDEATLEVSHMLKDTGVEYIRVHDVLAHRELAA